MQRFKRQKRSLHRFRFGQEQHFDLPRSRRGQHGNTRCSARRGMSQKQHYAENTEDRKSIGLWAEGSCHASCVEHHASALVHRRSNSILDWSSYWRVPWCSSGKHHTAILRSHKWQHCGSGIGTLHYREEQRAVHKKSSTWAKGIWWNVSGP